MTKEVYHDRLRKAVPRSPLNKVQSLRRNFAILIVFSLVFALASCDPDPEPDPKPDPQTPSCTITNHAIDDDLSCGHTAKVYGTVNGIPVYRTKAVTDAQMSGVVANVQAGYDSMVSNKANINTTKVSAFHIDTSDGIKADSAKWIIRLNYTNDTPAMTARLQLHGGAQLAMQLKQFGNPEQPVRIGHAMVPIPNTHSPFPFQPQRSYVPL